MQREESRIVAKVRDLVRAEAYRLVPEDAPVPPIRSVQQGIQRPYRRPYKAFVMAAASAVAVAVLTTAITLTAKHDSDSNASRRDPASTTSAASVSAHSIAGINILPQVAPEAARNPPQDKALQIALAGAAESASGLGAPYFGGDGALRLRYTSEIGLRSANGIEAAIRSANISAETVPVELEQAKTTFSDLNQIADRLVGFTAGSFRIVSTGVDLLTNRVTLESTSLDATAIAKLAKMVDPAAIEIVLNRDGYTLANTTS